MKNKIVLLFALFLFSHSGNAFESQSLSKCIQIGLEQNFDIRIAKKGQQITEQNVTLGNAGILPTVDLNSGINLSGNKSTQQLNNGDGINSIRNVNTETVSAGVNLDWMLFNGFKAQTSYKKLKELNEVGILRTEASIENYIATFSAEYYNYVQQKIRLKNLRYAVNLSRERKRIVEEMYQIGYKSLLDLQQARVDFNTDSSRLWLQNEQLNASRIKLNELMGNKDVDTELEVKDSSINIVSLLNKDELEKNLFSKNIIMKFSEKEKLISELDLKLAESQNFPYLRLSSGYGFTHFNYSQGNIHKQNAWSPNVGLTLGFRLFDGFNKSREQKIAKFQIENKELENEQLQLNLRSQFTIMWLSYINYIELITLEEISLENAKSNHEIALERYKLGDLSGIELREAQNNLLAAEERLLSTIYSTKLYEISLNEITGRINYYLNE